MLSILMVGLVMCAFASGADLYGSPHGSDNTNGSKDGRFATLERAQGAILEMKDNNVVPEDGVTVWLWGGDYLRTASFELASEDSGTPDASIVWQSPGKETVRLLGGRIITGFGPVTDETVRAGLSEDARDQVSAVDLRAQGIEHCGKLRSRGCGRSAASCGEFFFAGKHMTLARWPNEGQWDHIAGFPEAGGSDDGHGTHMGHWNRVFPPERPPGALAKHRQYLDSRLPGL